MSTRLSRRLVLGVSLASLLSSPLAFAQTKPWPTAKPITWMVGFVPGGSVDALTRAFAQSISAQIGQTIVIENKPGASGALALQAAARAGHDGYTLITIPGQVVHATRQPGVDKEFRAIGLLSQGPIVMIGGAANAPADLAALIAAMKKTPDRWTFASSGTGTGQHLAGELFNSMAGTQMTHIPYRGGGQAVSDIMGAQVSLGMLGVTPVLSHIQSGALKAYAVTTPYRIPSLPDVPTMEEAGLKGYDATQYFVMAAPAGIDPAIVDKLNASIATAARSPEVTQALNAGGQVFQPLSPADTQRFVQKSLDKFQDVAKRANIRFN
jgi:tripartite-type tricarboxylate transporter receptor subunit TctC